MFKMKVKVAQPFVTMKITFYHVLSLSYHVTEKEHIT